MWHVLFAALLTLFGTKLLAILINHQAPGPVILLQFIVNCLTGTAAISSWFLELEKMEQRNGN